MKIYLLVEGITDIAFVKYICYQNDITKNFDDFKKKKNYYTFNNLVLINLDGQDNLKKELEYLKDEELEISKIAIIQDADNDFQESLNNINNAIKESKINQEKKLISQDNIFLTPNNKDLGDLETLLLSTIKNNDIVQCFEHYKKCLQKNSKIYEKALNKGQVYAYTMYSQSGKDLHKPQDLFMYKYDKEYRDTKLWNLKKDEFKPIENFVLKILKGKDN
jgi:hypothetical protein